MCRSSEVAKVWCLHIVFGMHYRLLNTCYLQVFEAFSPVKKPYYSVCVNSPDHLGLTSTQLVLYIVADLEMTKYVFTDKLMR